MSPANATHLSSLFKWWGNEPFPGSCLRRKMHKLTRQGERRCAYVILVLTCPLPWCGLANVLLWTDISSRMFILDRWAFVVAELVYVVSSLSVSALIFVSFVFFQTLE